MCKREVFLKILRDFPNRVTEVRDGLRYSPGGSSFALYEVYEAIIVIAENGPPRSLWLRRDYEPSGLFEAVYLTEAPGR